MNVRMMAEQMFLTHHVIGRLHARAAMLEASNNLDVFVSGAARMMGEFRRHSALFTELNAKCSKRNGATNQLSPGAKSQAVDAIGKKSLDSKLLSKRVAGVKIHAA